ncbi:hypothetical protein AKAW_08790 [Aspergillus luchuensis IFO 4308]|nr:hypothetical protein AKAW_08790 [Aspergillus luchuensis IFO 4308]
MPRPRLTTNMQGRQAGKADQREQEESRPDGEQGPGSFPADGNLRRGSGIHPWDLLGGLFVPLVSIAAISSEVQGQSFVCRRCSSVDGLGRVG